MRRKTNSHNIVSLAVFIKLNRYMTFMSIQYQYSVSTCQRSYRFGRRHSCGSSCSCGPVRCSLVLELVRTMVLSIGVASYVQDVGRLTNEVARVTSLGYVRGSRAASFSTVRLVARASSRPSQSVNIINPKNFVCVTLNSDFLMSAWRPTSRSRRNTLWTCSECSNESSE